MLWFPRYICCSKSVSVLFLCSHHCISFPVCVLKYIFSITCYFRLSYTSFYSWSGTVSRLSSSKCWVNKTLPSLFHPEKNLLYFEVPFMSCLLTMLLSWFFLIRKVALINHSTWLSPLSTFFTFYDKIYFNV